MQKIVGLIVTLTILLIVLLGGYFVFKRNLQTEKVSSRITVVSDVPTYNIQATDSKFLSKIAEDINLLGERKVTWHNKTAKALDKITLNTLVIHFTNNVESRNFDISRLTILESGKDRLYAAAHLEFDPSTAQGDLYIYLDDKYYESKKQNNIEGGFSFTVMNAFAILTKENISDKVDSTTHPDYFNQRNSLPNKSFVSITKK